VFGLIKINQFRKSVDLEAQNHVESVF